MSATVDPSLKSREEQDAELDRRIEALRKKNEALMKRHQEIEEDRKKAEEDGISVTTRRPKYEAEHDRKQNGKGVPPVAGDLSKSPTEKRMVNDRKPRSNLGSPGRRGWAGNPGSPASRPTVDQGIHYSSPGNWPDRMPRMDRTERSSRGFTGHEGPEGEWRGRGRRGRGGRGGGGIDGGFPTGVPPQDRRVKEWEEKRRQNIEKMNEEMEKIAEYERGQMGGIGEKNPVRNFLDDPRRLGSLPDGDRKDGSRRHVRNWGGPNFDKVKTGLDRGKDRQGRRSGSRGSFDMTLSMTGRERTEYMRWKEEREQIDQERLARHRNATGQWRREWDAEKTESMFKESSRPTEEGSIRDEQRPPKAPTISDFIFQSKSKDSGRGRAKHREKNYSMHDDRWETPEAEQEEKREKELKAQPVQDPVLTESKVGVDESPADDLEDSDDDLWEDASDSEEEIVGEDVSDSEEVVLESNEEKKKDGGMKERLMAADVKCTEQSPQVEAKKQRVRKPPEMPRLRVDLKNVAGVASETESKPLSPFSLDEYHPVKDWAEEMEITSPRTSVVQNPLQSATTGKSSQEESQTNVELGSGDTPTECESRASDVRAGQESVATAELRGSGGDVPAGENPEEKVTDDTATVQAAQVVEQERSRLEGNVQTDEGVEPTNRTSQSTDCVEEIEPISG